MAVISGLFCRLNLFFLILTGDFKNNDLIVDLTFLLQQCSSIGKGCHQSFTGLMRLTTISIYFWMTTTSQWWLHPQIFLYLPSFQITRHFGHKFFQFMGCWCGLPWYTYTTKSNFPFFSVDFRSKSDFLRIFMGDRAYLLSNNSKN